MIINKLVNEACNLLYLYHSLSFVVVSMRGFTESVKANRRCACVLSIVINVTLPDEKQNYVHRIGRVGRAERYAADTLLQMLLLIIVIIIIIIREHLYSALSFRRNL